MRPYKTRSTRDRSTTHNLAKMSVDEVLDLTAVVNHAYFFIKRLEAAPRGSPNDPRTFIWMVGNGVISGPV